VPFACFLGIVTIAIIYRIQRDQSGRKEAVKAFLGMPLFPLLLLGPFQHLLEFALDGGETTGK
jgi:4-amino-4-deoxy-L-arabinose transferase-like glycosyltransferase